MRWKQSKILRVISETFPLSVQHGSLIRTQKYLREKGDVSGSHHGPLPPSPALVCTWLPGRGREVWGRVDKGASPPGGMQASRSAPLVGSGLPSATELGVGKCVQAGHRVPAGDKSSAGTVRSSLSGDLARTAAFLLFLTKCESSSIPSLFLTGNQNWLCSGGHKR